MIALINWSLFKLKKYLYRILKILGIMLTEASLIMTVFSSTSWAGKPIRMAITDLEGLEQLQREFGSFRDLLSKKTGLTIKFFPVASRTAAVEGMRSKKIDFVWRRQDRVSAVRSLHFWRN